MPLIIIEPLADSERLSDMRITRCRDHNHFNLTISQKHLEMEIKSILGNDDRLVFVLLGVSLMNHDESWDPRPRVLVLED